MKKYSLILTCLVASILFFSMKITPPENPSIKVKYPATKKENVSDSHFGTTINDPYRWLENDTAKEVETWVNTEIKTTEDYLSQIPYRLKIKERLKQIFNYPKYGLTFKKGDYYFFSKNDGLQNLAVTYRQKGLDGTPEVFLDPNTLSKDGTISSGLGEFSHDNKYVAVIVNKAGSDWQEMQVMNVETMKQTGDTLRWVKFSDAAWYKNGFYYSRYDAPKGSALSVANEYQKIYYHEMGTPQSMDKLVYEDKEHPKRYFSASVTEDEKYLLIYISEGTQGTELWLKDLQKGEKDFKKVLPGFEFNYSVVDNDGDNLLVLTNNGADNYRVVSVSPVDPSPSNWKIIIPEQKQLLQNVSTAGGKMFAEYLQDASSRVYQFSYGGNKEGEIKLSGIGSVSGFSGSRKDAEVFYGFTSFTVPYEIYKYDINGMKSALYKKTEANFESTQFETIQKFYTSKDGTKVPMFITCKKGIKLDGTNPCMLYGYGGFNIALTPGFSASNIFFLENGGIYAVANLRGGNEYGEAWHKAGMLLNKQTVFDDFISAAEYLISEKYTSTSKLAIYGRSNGGLLVGAAMTQRPDLFKVALPTVGVLDMLRYHKFTVGWGWAVEYGSSDDEKYFKYLLGYSPLHNLKSGAQYPATMIMTADHDDRVVPAHSFKFGATLQELYKGDRPMLLRIEKNAGHGSGGAGSLSKIIEQETDRWTFVLYNLDMNY